MYILRTAYVFIVFMFCGLIMLGQTNAHYSYPTELKRVDSSRIELRKQESDFILGQEFPEIRIVEVVYHKQANVHLVYGFIDDVNYNQNDNYKIDISIMNGEKVIYKTSSSRNGIFSIAVHEGEKIRFMGDLFIDLYILK